MPLTYPRSRLKLSPEDASARRIIAQYIKNRHPERGPMTGVRWGMRCRLPLSAEETAARRLVSEYIGATLAWKRRDPTRHRETMRRYEHSPKGIAMLYRRSCSPKGRAAARRAKCSPKGIAADYRYRHSPKGIAREATENRRAWHRAWWKSPKGLYVADRINNERKSKRQPLAGLNSRC